jgi:choline monooxygenase
MTYRFNAEDMADMEIRPLELAETIPARWFTSPAMHELDREQVLARTWQYVGHVSQFPESGDLIVDEVLGRPVLLVRNQSGDIHCFSNVCRHRGGPVATKNQSSRVLRCAYHAWTYNLDGQLMGAPKFDGAKNFNKHECALPKYRIENYSGFLFVNFSGDAPPLAEHLAGIKEAIAPIDLSEMSFHRRVTYKVKANWKVYIDNYMEGYHILPVHPGLAKILDISGYTTTIEGHKVLQYGPLSGADNPYHTDGAAWYYQVFPNLMLNILPGRCQVNSILPIDADHCLTVFDFFYSERDPEKLAVKAGDDLKISDVVQLEDIEICELVQKGLTSGSYNKGRVCPAEEMGVWAFHNNLRRSYQSIARSQRENV